MTSDVLLGAIKVSTAMLIRAVSNTSLDLIQIATVNSRRHMTIRVIGVAMAFAAIALNLEHK